MKRSFGRYSWDYVESLLMDKPYQDFRIEKSLIDHPSKAGFKRSLLGEIRGQIADWRKTLPDGSCIHVVEYEDHYLIHRDTFNPDENPIGHLLYDAPHWLAIIALGTLGAIALYAFMKRKKASL